MTTSPLPDSLQMTKTEEAEPFKIRDNDVRETLLSIDPQGVITYKGVRYVPESSPPVRETLPESEQPIVIDQPEALVRVADAALSWRAVGPDSGPGWDEIEYVHDLGEALLLRKKLAALPPQQNHE